MPDRRYGRAVRTFLFDERRTYRDFIAIATCTIATIGVFQALDASDQAKHLGIENARITHRLATQGVSLRLQTERTRLLGVENAKRLTETHRLAVENVKLAQQAKKLAQARARQDAETRALAERTASLAGRTSALAQELARRETETRTLAVRIQAERRGACEDVNDRNGAVHKYTDQIPDDTQRGYTNLIVDAALPRRDCAKRIKAAVPPGG